MIYSEQQLNMNFNLLPGFRRPTDFSVSSILGTNNSDSVRLPKLPDMLAAEAMLGQHQLALRGLENPRGSPPDSSADITDDANVELESMDLWEQFHEIGTEMVITKCGR